jgi:lysophospholipase L1-like esterase
MPVPPVLVVCPPPILNPRGAVAEKFSGADRRCVGLADAYRAAASTLGCHFFDAASVTSSSRVDGVHLDEDQHLALGRALVDVVGSILGSG